ncbi:MAG: hypothetical protein WBV06_04875 [Acidimicrobiia bacterium]
MGRFAIVGVLVALLLAACSGDQGTDTTVTTTAAETTLATETTMAAETTTADMSDGEPPDNCSLITAEEATALAGHTLDAGEDSMLGCGFIPPDGSIADMSVIAFERDGDAASVAATDFPDAAQTIPVSVGTDTVAVTNPEGDTVGAIVTGDGGRFVELQIIFLGIDPGDMSRIEDAAQLATKALGRWQ